MQLRRFITERTKLRVGSSVKILEDEAFHIRKSLRLQPDDEIILFNGEKEYKARLKIVSKDVVMAEIVEELAVLNTDGKTFTLLQGLIRSANFELVLQKVTELGINRLIPLMTEFSQININQVENKLERWQKIMVEACKQSERLSIPEIVEPLSFKDIATVRSDFDLVILFTIARDTVSAIRPVLDIHDMQSQIAAAKNIAYLVGPEGGFSPTEHKLAHEWDLPFVTLGNHILKAETAAIAAQATLNYLAA